LRIQILKNYIGGKWLESKSGNLLDVTNPSTGEVITKVPLSRAAEANDAIKSAAEAFRSWSKTSVSTRCNYIFKLRELVEENEDELTRLICFENGKSIPDANAEIKRMRQNIEVACGMPTLMKSEKLVEVAVDIDTETIRLPIGVFAMVAPFNFPAMVPFWFMPYAIAAGNTYVLKPSEQVPLTQEFIFKLIEKTGLPAGVVNLVNGSFEVVDEILISPAVKGVSFVGQTKTAHKVLETCAKYSKRCQSMGGAKNYLVVMPDANLDKVVTNMITSCFGCAGQRCMAASIIVCVGDEIYEKTKKAFVEAADKMIVANPLDPKYKDEPILMGPVISKVSKDRILACIETAKKEGFKVLLDKSDIKIKGCENGYFVGPVIFGDVKAGSLTERTEIFGPVVGMMKVDSLDEVIRYLDENPFGNGASIYTQNGYWARKFEIEAQCGMIGINLGVPAPVAYFPFGGMKESQLSDIKSQASRVVDFYTEEKIITRRFFA
jgi:malonate-semialdehyde dehydrogenase (acetylating)/methylmalonate-semialdehyde dehydrogenase